jgi:hypothetical protein
MEEAIAAAPRRRTFLGAVVGFFLWLAGWIFLKDVI